MYRIIFLFCKAIKPFVLSLILIACFTSIVYAQKDTIHVPGFYESAGQYGTLNQAVELAKANIISILQPLKYLRYCSMAKVVA